MNAPNPSGGERDFDALRRAQRAHEPSMEEILASIRAIIADDRGAESGRPTPGPKPATGTGPQIVYSKDSPATPRTVPEDETAPPKSQSPEPPVADTPQAAWRRPEEALGARPETEQSSRAEEEAALESESLSDEDPSGEAPLLSEDADRAVSESFNALSTSLTFPSAELLEGMTREMLRPMIKTWLDEHLPSLVERLVRAEIQRVARGGR